MINHDLEMEKLFVILLSHCKYFGFGNNIFHVFFEMAIRRARTSAGIRVPAFRVTV
jgi:hypothetical protein